MATISFKEDLMISDKEKIIEIAQALKQQKGLSVHSMRPPKLPDNAKAIWFAELKRGKLKMSEKTFLITKE